MQLTAQLFILTYDLGVFLFELADAQRWWWESSDLFGRERKRRLEFCHRLLKLLDVCLSFCAMPRLGLCITTALGAVTGSARRAIGCWLCHGVLQVEKERMR
jgi:hypothetical protein